MRDSIPPLPGSSPDEMFPVLTAEQQARVLTHGRARKVASGETLVELNQQPTKIFVMVQGRLELFQISDKNEQIIAVCVPGMFTGELNMLSGRRGLVSIRVAEAGVLLIESNAPGGQAGASSKIENYLGFPTGISGRELAGAAYTQAQKFGAQLLIARSAKGLSCDRRPYALKFDGEEKIPARTVVIATGAQYRKLQLDNLSKFEGAGVYYSATHLRSADVWW